MGFQQGLSGLNAAARGLDVIGHNIANANTVGMKSSRAEFADVVASAIGTSGGSNYGIGVEVNAVAQQFTQGNISITGNNLDVAINGNGFFTVRLPDGSDAYTRAGNFKLDKEGNVITNEGAFLQGYQLDPVTGAVSSGEPVDVNFPTGAPIDPKQTGTITAAFNLDARATDAAGDPAATPPIAATPRSKYGTSINVYDSEGVAKPVNLYFEKSANPNEWNVFTDLDPAATAVGTITFDNFGKLTGVTSATPPATTVPPASVNTIGLDINPTPPNPNGLPNYVVNLNLDDVTQFGSKFAVSDLAQDGYAAGELTGISVQNDGTVMSRYSNGVTRAEYQLVLTNFRNVQGLAPVGGNNWVQTFASGEPVKGTPGAGNFGTLRSGALEDSNVDLTAELVNMMTAQRSYQANAQTIKTQDQIMSTLVNLR
jgi:flagellar hook protein FlgE